MPDLKISQLTDGGAAQATDEFVVARGGGNNKITGANVTSIINASATQSGSALVNQADIGSAPNEVPLNQYLGTMAYQDAAGVNIAGGTANLSTLDVSGTTILASSSGDLIVGNGDAAASPAARIIRGTNGSGTNIAGANLTIQGGRGTGSGKGGDIIFQSSAAGASGTTLQTAAEVARVSNTGTISAVAFSSANRNVQTGTIGTVMTASTGTLVFSFSIGATRSGIVRIAFAGRAGTNTASQSPACEYIGQVHSTSANVITFNGATTIFEYQFVRATHLAFADTGSGTFTLTLTNPVAAGQALASTWLVETMGSNPSFTGFTVT